MCFAAQPNIVHRIQYHLHFTNSAINRILVCACVCVCVNLVALLDSLLSPTNITRAVPGCLDFLGVFDFGEINM